jgi:SAM-dependent methyltransferase
MKRSLRSLVDKFIPVLSNRRMLYRAVRDVLQTPRSFSNRLNAANVRNLLRYRWYGFNCPICGENVFPLYDFPDIPLRIEHKIGILRETLQCKTCLASMRQRSLAVTLLRFLNRLWSTQLTSISELGSHGLQGLKILDSDNFSAISKIMRNVDGYTRCSYIPNKTWGACLEPNYYNQDLQDLSFEDAAFDIVLTSDVMEHVRDCDSAHREIYRVLKQGGAYMFNVPYDMNVQEDIRLVDTSTSSDIYLCKPQIHGDPLTGGVLAYRVFGRSLTQRLEALGFEVEFHLLQRPENLIIDGDVFVARKPPPRGH